MKTKKFAQDIRKFALNGIKPPWADSIYCFVSLHTDEPSSSMSDNAIKYEGYTPVKVLRSNWQDEGERTVNTEDIMFPKYVAKDGRVVEVNYICLTIGDTLAYVNKLPEPVVLVSGNIPLFEKGGIEFIEN